MGRENQEFIVKTRKQKRLAGRYGKRKIILKQLVRKKQRGGERKKMHRAGGRKNAGGNKYSSVAEKSRRKPNKKKVVIDLRGHKIREEVGVAAELDDATRSRPR